MPIYHPPRREPRVLALAIAGDEIAWAVADPYMIRGAGRAAGQLRSRPAMVQRLVRREKPTLLVVGSEALAGVVARVARRTGVPVAAGRPPRLSRSIACDLYPELRALAPGRLESLAVRAVAAVLYADTPSRRYAPRRNRPLPRRS